MRRDIERKNKLLGLKLTANGGNDLRASGPAAVVVSALAFQQLLSLVGSNCEEPGRMPKARLLINAKPNAVAADDAKRKHTECTTEVAQHFADEFNPCS